MSLIFSVPQPNVINLMTASINSFDEGYHADYFSVRYLSDLYLSKDHKDLPLNNALACVLHVVLKRFGAERQKAPTRKMLSKYEDFFSLQETHALLRKFYKATSNILPNEDYISILNQLSNGLFVNNTNVTYPMKALMLLTGYNFALDSQVRSGLAAAGISGVSATQFLLPSGEDSLEGKKIINLSSMFYEFYYQNKFTIDEAVSKSNYKGIGQDIGRIFDVLLFMQADPAYKVLTYSPTSRGISLYTSPTIAALH